MINKVLEKLKADEKIKTLFQNEELEKLQKILSNSNSEATKKSSILEVLKKDK